MDIVYYENLKTISEGICFRSKENFDLNDWTTTIFKDGCGGHLAAANKLSFPLPLEVPHKI